MSGAPDSIDWKSLRESAGPYPMEAFVFVQEGLAHTAERVREESHGLGMAPPDSRHVTGQQLCMGLRAFAIERYGMLAPAVLRHWQVTRTEDFGRIVYAMIEAGLMSKTAEDSYSDFCGVYDFAEAFAESQMAERIGIPSN